MKADRLTQAAALRLAIYTWLDQNPFALMAEVFDAFPDMKAETVRKAIIKMRQNGSVVMLDGSGCEGKYSATGIRPQGAVEVRENMRTSIPRLDKLLENQHRRQAVLDALHEQPGQTAQQLAAAIGVPAKLMIGSLHTMRNRGEVKSSGTHSAMVFVALVDTTVSAQSLYDATAKGREERQRESEAMGIKTRHEPEPNEPWRYVHKGGCARATDAGQGGQGAIRPRVYVNSSHNY